MNQQNMPDDRDMMDVQEQNDDQRERDGAPVTGECAEEKNALRGSGGMIKNINYVEGGSDEKRALEAKIIERGYVGYEIRDETSEFFNKFKQRLNILRRIATITSNDEMDLIQGITHLAPRREFDENGTDREDSIFVYGTSRMGARDMFGFFNAFNPIRLEWLDECSCVLVFASNDAREHCLNSLIASGSIFPTQESVPGIWYRSEPLDGCASRIDGAVQMQIRRALDSDTLREGYRGLAKTRGPPRRFDSRGPARRSDDVRRETRDTRGGEYGSSYSRPPYESSSRRRDDSYAPPPREYGGRPHHDESRMPPPPHHSNRRDQYAPPPPSHRSDRDVYRSDHRHPPSAPPPHHEREYTRGPSRRDGPTPHDSRPPHHPRDNRMRSRSRTPPRREAHSHHSAAAHYHLGAEGGNASHHHPAHSNGSMNHYNSNYRTSNSAYDRRPPASSSENIDSGRRDHHHPAHHHDSTQGMPSNNHHHPSEYHNSSNNHNSYR
eukprot:GDKJ01026098.1.p1 GENE.GDKJ01026098.1~~GDKJ01026098.1.p1  ORF type:complete len:522 (-),score=146.15 GDKJ01026098.1:93-1574(-)